MAITLWSVTPEGPQSLGIVFLEATLDDGRSAWLDLEIEDIPELKTFGEILPGHALNWEDAGKPGQRPKLEDHGDHLFLIVRGLNTAVVRLARQLETMQLAAFLTPRLLVTIRSGPLHSVDHVAERIMQGIPLLQSGPDAVLHAILDNLVDAYAPHVERWEEEVERLEREAILNPRNTVLARILHIRKHLTNLRRIAIGQKEILLQLSREHHGLVQEDHRPYFRDVYDHLVAVVDISDTLRENVTLAVDIFLNAVNNRLNQVMKVLTLISAIMLPLTLLSGIYGMNFDYMPGLRHPAGFFVMMGLMLAVGLGMVWLFRRMHWL